MAQLGSAPALVAGAAGSNPAIRTMEKDKTWITELFYSEEVEKWRKLANAKILENQELRSQIDELRAEVQRLQKLAVY